MQEEFNKIPKEIKFYVFIKMILMFLLLMIVQFISEKIILNSKLVILFWIMSLSFIILLIEIIFLKIQCKVISKNQMGNELVTLRKEISEQEKRYNLAIDGIKDVTWEWDFRKNVIFMSNKWKSITGYLPGKYENAIEFMKEIIHIDDINKAKADFKDYMAGKVLYHQSEFRVKTKYDGYKWLYISGKALKDSENKIIKMSGSITDITDRKQFEEEIRHMAYHDALTDLPNKTLFMNILEKTIEDHKLDKGKGAIIFLDLDDFKKVNDTLGHDYGDQLLKIISEVLKLTFNEDDVIARLGGDEFLILVKNIMDPSDITTLCDKLINTFKNHFEIGDKYVYTSASMGITMFPDKHNDINELLRNADTAMYKAKASGKNKYCFFDKSISDELIRKIEIEKCLRNAIKNDEFEIYYQPQIDIKRNRIKGLEALLRWNSKKFGMISPVEFIPIAEEMGLIASIGEWVLKNVCIQVKEWEDRKYNFEYVAVNVSSIQLQDDNFINKVKRILNETNIKSQYIEFEITETALMNDVELGVRIFNELKSMGFKIALDDFGTGYSSLNYLKVLPINNLKIDKSFVDHMIEDKKNQAMVDGIIKLVHKMEINVIAEGVETKGQLELLESMDCDVVQGYYFSKALPSNEIETTLQK